MGAHAIRWVGSRPAMPVSRFVESIWEMEGHWEGARFIFPKPVVDVVFSLRSASDPAAGENASTDESPTAWIAGIHDAVRVEEGGKAHWVGIRFRPGMARAFLGVPLDELVDRRVPLDTILGADAGRTLTRLSEAANRRERFRVLESLLVTRLRHAQAPDGVLQRALAILRQNAGFGPVGSVAGAAGLRPDVMIDLIKKEVGVPPKKLARILRLHHALAMLVTCPSFSLGRVAGELGFADQAHFTREFRAMTGQTPGAYRRRLLVQPGRTAR